MSKHGYGLWNVIGHFLKIKSEGFDLLAFDALDENMLCFECLTCALPFKRFNDRLL